MHPGNGVECMVSRCNGTLEDDAVRIYIWQSDNLALKVTFCVPIAPKFEV